MLTVYFVLLSMLSFGLIQWAMRARTDNRAVDPIQFYKDQLDELDRDLASNYISEEQAQSARLEIQRRILRQGKKSDTGKAESSNFPLFIALGVIVVLGAVALYNKVGSPALPAAENRSAVMEETVIDDKGTTLQEAIDKSMTEMEAAPDNLDLRWRMASAMSQLERHSDAAKIYSDGAGMEPDVVDWPIKLGESIMRMHDGQIAPASLLAFRSVLNVDPEHPAAHYYIGVWHVQSGNDARARETFMALKNRSEPEAPWLPMVNEQLSRIDGTDQSTVGQAARDVENMSEEDQRAFIASMVARLEAKLEANPFDTEGWLMLARTKENLEGAEAARRVLKTALTKVSNADKTQLQEALEALN